ncbi:MAG: bifunctional phosphopantothenoylcysteine decarboxylase/phosphopantothenate--cysteine ligase CoaBC [Betaproteobacteria bacterium]|nr:bifunctional phosphopantothenoylcysteine decarboxylase/phosphopantothenate--cysteine ligase CoaBC [Betaproteobacteria bacterium]
MQLQGKHILLGMSGGIAAYKGAELCRAFVKEGATVQVVMTEAAQHFITPVTMQALSGRSVVTHQWDARVPNNMAHIELSRAADCIVVAPASADLMAKAAQGFADDLLSTLILARQPQCALLLAPAMNREMWAAPATQRNAAQLRQDGVLLLGPAAGDQACGEIGDGRMLEPLELLADVVAHFQPKHLAGRQVLITAGPTYEAIDPVRGLTNLSSGKMGYALARACAEAGAAVTLVSGPTALDAPRHVQHVGVTSAQQMADAVLSRLAGCDVFIAAAAVADWRVADASAVKLKKAEASAPPSLQFVENPDILASVAAHAAAHGGRPFCVGFAAESHDLVAQASAKRARKGVALLVGNLGPATFGQDDNEIVLFDAQGHRALPRADKLTLARQLVAEIAQRIAG